MDKVTKAVIPAAGYGTRFLPATKAVPKEMLPIVDSPAIHYIVEECVLSGITDICIILGRNKNTIADYFDKNFEVETALLRDKKMTLIKKMNELSEKANICYVRQREMKGTGPAILLAEAFIGNDPFAVLFGDDVMYSPDNPVTKQLIGAYENTGKTIVGVQNVKKEDAPKYGVIVPGATKGRYTEILGMAEKCPIDKLPSTLASLGRYVLSPSIFDYIKATAPAPSGEIYLPHAIMKEAGDLGAYAYTFEGRRYDIGDKQGYLEATVEYALRNPELKDNFLKYLKGLI